jgi:hypothetical protein
MSIAEFQADAHDHFEERQRPISITTKRGSIAAEHVHVNEGGQAIIGNVRRGTAGGRVLALPPETRAMALGDERNWSDETSTSSFPRARLSLFDAHPLDYVEGPH